MVLGERLMRKQLIVLGVIFTLLTSGCITSVQRIIDKDFDAQQNQKETETMFPDIPGLYAWIETEFVKQTVDGTRALPKNLQFGYQIDKPRPNVPYNCIYVRANLSYLGFFDKKDDYQTHFNVQDALVINFAKAHGYTIKKYKFGFSERLFKNLELKNIALFQNAVNIRYGYSYVISKNGSAIMTYLPIIYGNYSKSRGEVTSYTWDAIFISARESSKFLDSLPNSFLADMKIDD